MSAYSKFVLTNKGVALLSDIINGNGILEFRYLATGSGEYAAKDTDTVSIREMETLKQERQQTAFAYIGETGEGLVNLKADVTNIELTEGYYLTEAGIYAGRKGEKESILYCVSTATEADYMPDYQEGIPYNVIFDVRIGIGDVDKVTITYQPDTYALVEDVLTHVSDETRHITAEERTRWDRQKVKIGLTDTELEVGDTLFVVEDEFSGAVVANFTLSANEPETDNWGMIEGDLAVSGEASADATFFAKISE